jgi:hypothetical protein
VQTGNAIDTLTTLKRATAGNIGWTATAGVTYHFAVGSFSHAGAPFQCTLSSASVSTNDNFAARIDLGSVTQGQWAVSTLLCSTETGEPAHGGQTATRSVWYDWTAPSSGGVLLEAVLGGFQARIGIYTGNAVNALQNLAGGSWKVPFTAVAGQTYRIAVDGTEGLGSLTLRPQALPSNDLFANRTVLTGGRLSIKGSTMLAGKETSEPGTTSAAQRSVWWEWVAPVSSSYTIVSAANTAASLAIYSSATAATGFSSLALVNSGGIATFFATAGRYYYFKVFTTTSSPNGDAFDFRIDRSQTVPIPPPNDSFANRISLGNQTGAKSTGDLYGSTLELGESGSASQGSLWWSWTAPSSGVFCLRRSGPQAVTMSIHTGTNLASLITVASGTGMNEWFRAVAGTTYQIRCLANPSISPSSSSRLLELEVVGGAPPANDAFAAAITLREPDTTSIEGYNAGASAEATEPAHSATAARASVWYRWTATAAGLIQISTTSATMVTGVYQGSGLDSLTSVAAGYTPLAFTAVPGQTYRIALDSPGDETFFIRLSRAIPAIANDTFSTPTPLSGATVEVPGSTVGATLEAGESYHTGSGSQGGSAWWLWTAPASGAVEVAATGSTLPHFAIYQGSALDSLQLVASGSGACSFQASAGSTYRFAASATSGTGTTFVLKVQQTANTPPNDAFAQARVLGSQDLVPGTLDGASREIGESWHGSGITKQTVWYRWTAPANGRARVTLRSGSPGSLVVYRGISLTGLSLIVSSAGDAGFQVAADDEIRILVGLGTGGISGAFELEIGMTDTGDNDSFADRIGLGSVAQVTWTGALEDATIESGETPSEYNDRGSRWWTWTAPADGGVSLKLGDGRIVPVAYVYTGTQLGSLNLLASSSNGSGLAFPALAGTTYQIALRGKPSSSGIGDFLAELSLQTLPNDNQAAAAILDGVLPVSGSALLAGATSELGESSDSGSVWWRWVSPISGQVDLDTSSSDILPNNAGVWTGLNLPWLQSVPLTSQGNQVRRFTVTAGTTYWIALSSSQDTVFGTVRLQLRQAFVPANDLFVNALPLSGEALSIDTLNYGATTEAGEPIPRSKPLTTVYSGSLWWKWVAPRTGLVRVNVSQGWAFLYEGASWEELREVAGPGGATNTTNAYWVEAGREYQVSAGNSSGGSVVATIALNPPGDSFDDSLEISGSWVKRGGSLANCFWEASEAFHAGSAPQATLWLRWRAPSGGNFRVMARSGTAALRAAVYFGNSISSLTELSSGNGAFVFTAVAGQEYRIVVDGGGTPGDFELVLAEEIPAYVVWRDSHFDFMDPASSPTEDPDFDGLANLLEASLGSDPQAFTPGPAFTVDSVGGKIKLNLRRQSDVSGWRYYFNLSASLGDWQSTDDMNRSETVEDHGDGTETLHIVLHDYLIADHLTVFVRLGVEALPPD